MLPVAPAPVGPVCHQVQLPLFVSPVPDPQAWTVDVLTLAVLRRSGPICLPTSSHIGQSVGEVAGLPMQQDHTDCPAWPSMPWFWDL